MDGGPAPVLGTAARAHARRGSLAGFGAVTRRAASWSALAVCCAVVVLIYGQALEFPFFYDDTFDMSRTESQSFLSLLGGIDGYAYYRPLPFLIWKAFYQLQGFYNPVLFHALALASHILAGWLLYLLVRRLIGSEWAIVPAMLFLTFPFSYQVVPVAGSLFHSLVTLFILATLYFYLLARLRGSWVFMAVSIVMAALALWTHEFGILVTGYLVALEGVLWLTRRVPRPTPWLLAHLTLGGLFALVWLSVQKVPSPVLANQEELIQKGLFFLQGMAYPVTAQLVPLQKWFGDDLGSQTLLAGGIGIGICLIAYLLAGRKSLIAVLAVIWALAALVPVWWRLNWPYVQDAPRLLYLASAGAAIFWGMLASLEWRYRALTVAWRVIVVAGLVAVVWQSAHFISIRMEMLRNGGQLVNAVAAAGKAHDGGSVLFLNVPSWFSAREHVYARGHLGVTVMPSYIGLDRVIYTHTGARTQAESLAFRADTETWRDYWYPHGREATAEEVDAAIRAADAVYAPEIDSDQFGIRDIGGLRRASNNGTSPLAAFDGRLDLVHAGVEGESGSLAIDLDWHVRSALNGAWLMDIQLRDGGGQVVSEWRGYALENAWAPRLWRQGDRITDRSVLHIPEPEGTGPFSVWLGFVPEAGSHLLPVTTTGTLPTSNGFVRIGTVGS